MNPRHSVLRKIFPWLLMFFFALQIFYYFFYFHKVIWKRIFTIAYYHHHLMINMRPKAIMYTYDFILNFVLYLFFVFVFVILAFIAFDSSQRNDIIRRLSKDNKNTNFDEDEKH